MVHISKHSQNITVIEQSEYIGAAVCDRCGEADFRAVAFVYMHGASMREFLSTLKALRSQWDDAIVAWASAKTGIVKLVAPQIRHHCLM